MVAAEQDFPRGGREITQNRRDSSNMKAKLSMRQSRPSTSKSGSFSARNRIWTKTLTVEDVTPGLLLLGCVRKVADDKLDMELPDKLSGIVEVTDISPHYTQCIKQAGADEDDEVSMLPEIYHVGQLLACKVKEVANRKGRDVVLLSIAPEMVNENLVLSSIVDGMIIQASVVSIEDKGYVMDLGISTVKAFLKAKHVERYLSCLRRSRLDASVSRSKLAVGETLLCSVRGSAGRSIIAGEDRVVRLSLDPDRFLPASTSERPETSSDHAHSDPSQLLPGMLLYGSVKQVRRTWILVTLEGLNMTGWVPQRSLVDVKDNTSNYTPGQILTLRILFTKPNSTILGLSLQRGIVNLCDFKKGLFGGISIGDTVEATVVALVGSGTGGVYFSVTRNGPFCYSSKPQLHSGNQAEDKISAKYALGSKHQCRIIGFNVLEDLLFVSTKKKVLRQPLVGLDDAKPGLVVKATVKAARKPGVLVMVLDHLRGFIPRLHTADVPLSEASVATRLAAGTKLSCRILAIDMDRQRLLLTNKVSLVNSALPVIDSYEAAGAGSVAEGVVVYIADSGVLIAFYNNVRGWIQRRELSTAGVECPSEAFYLGQILRVIISDVDVANEKLSLRLSTSGSCNTAEAAENEETEQSHSLGLNEVFSVRVESVVAGKGLRVSIIPIGVPGFIPMAHLSDWPFIASILLCSFRSGDVIDQCAYFADGNVATISRKPGIVHAAAHGALIGRFEALEKAALVYGIVSRHNPTYGYFIDIPGNMCGLMPHGALTVTDPLLVRPDGAAQEQLMIGQTIVAKINHVDLGKKRFSLSLLSEADRTEPSYLETRQAILRGSMLDYQRVFLVAGSAVSGMAGSPLAEFVKGIDGVTIGSSVTYHQSKKAAVGAADSAKTVLLDNGLCGRVVHPTSSGSTRRVIDGKSGHGIVLDFDFSEREVILSEDIEIAAGAAGHGIRPESDDSGGSSLGLLDSASEEMKAIVLYCKPEWCLVLINPDPNEASTEHLPRRIGYLPTDQFAGCVTTGSTMVDRESVFSVRIYDKIGKFGILLDTSDNIKRVEEESSKGGTESTMVGSSGGKRSKAIKVAAGGIYPAVVKTIGEFSTDVLVSGYYRGTVHVSEMVDTVTDKERPLGIYSVGQRIRVKVIDIHVSRSQGVRTKTLDCTLKPSKLAPRACNKKKSLLPRSSFSVDDVVPVFVEKTRSEFCDVILNRNWRGRAELMELSSDVNVLADPSTHFKVGLAYNARVLSVNEKKRHVAISFLMNQMAVDIFPRLLTGQIVSSDDSPRAKLRYPGGLAGVVAATDICDDYDEVGSSLAGLVSQRFVETCLVTRVPNSKKRVFASLRQSDICGTSIGLKDPPVRLVDDLSDGLVLRGFVVNTTSNAILIRLGTDVVGRVPLQLASEYFIATPSEAFPKGRVVTVKVTSTKPKIELSMLASDTNIPDQAPVRFRGQRKRKVSNDLSTVGESVPAKKLKSESTKAIKQSANELAIVEAKSDTEDDNAADHNNALPTLEEIVSRPARSSQSIESDPELSDDLPSLYSERDQDETVSSPVLAAAGSSTKGPTHLAESEDKISDSHACLPVKTNVSEVRLHLPAGCDQFRFDRSRFSMNNLMKVGALESDKVFGDLSRQVKRHGACDSHSSTDDEEDKVMVPTPVREKSKKETLEEEKQREAYLYQKEMASLNPSMEATTSADSLERLLLGSPDSSLLWLRYMAVFLEAVEADKARAVANRALKTISFREDQERLNVWTALMNLENMHGSKESLDEVMQRAVIANDPIKVYMQLAEIYSKTEKRTEASELFQTMTRKFKSSADVWLAAGNHYMKFGDIDQARKLMQRALKSLEQKEHISVISKFAQWEFQYGDKERGKTLFESIITSYPKRMDIWSVYIDMVGKYAESEQARSLFERALALKLSLRQIKSLCKKWLSFEERFGDDDSRLYVKKKAFNFAESLKSSLD